MTEEKLIQDNTGAVLAFQKSNIGIDRLVRLSLEEIQYLDLDNVYIDFYGQQDNAKSSCIYIIVEGVAYQHVC
jgi:hypothetical protein